MKTHFTSKVASCAVSKFLSFTARISPRDFLSILYGRHLLIDAEQLPQFKFGSKQVLESVLIQFLKKSLDRFRHRRAQCTTRCDPAVALRIFAFDHREVWFHFS